MVDDSIAAEEIARQIAALKPRVEGSRGIMGYLDKPQYDNRADVNKTFLASTIRGVNSHNRRQEEDKCWTLRQMERKLDDSRDRRADRRSHSRSRRRSNERKRRRSPSRSRSRSSSRHRKWTRSGSRRNSSRRSRSRDRSPVAELHSGKKNEEDERSYWARKKADKTRKLWENLHSEGTVSVENAPDFSSEESDDDDVKPKTVKSLPPPDRIEKKHKKHKKHKKRDRKNDKKSKRRS
ncbi:hypothetical protein PC121_g3358 [Phytophthora cactorum]|nr:hypothetical protein PC120_g5898 [Phytophthora cactorum]KAG3093119.1 hypothetical protein PC121_g3358 [Phytophthora cactorum]KAG4059077.1 hypothetical protein PC123_g5966 [Phytophthora cactorum]